MKVAPLYRAFSAVPSFHPIIVHTGQHYGPDMSEVFFRQLGLPQPDYHLGIGSDTPVRQTARIMTAFEAVLEHERPDLVVVTGDVNSTLACALTTAKMGIALAHVEAGLRSGDRSMPEEINRILTDAISDYLFVTEQSGLDHLNQEGIPAEKVFFTGNCMIDSLVYLRGKAAGMRIVEGLHLQKKGYILMTMHRPANVDTLQGLESILQIIDFAANYTQVVFPVHPRTGHAFRQFGLEDRLASMPNLHLLGPQGYLEFLNLLEHATAVMTDSGGIQEETTYLGVPCFTFRSSTERPVTVTMGTNTLLGNMAPEIACACILEVLEGRRKTGAIPPLWDGHAAVRIADLLLARL